MQWRHFCHGLNVLNIRNSSLTIIRQWLAEHILVTLLLRLRLRPLLFRQCVGWRGHFCPVHPHVLRFRLLPPRAGGAPNGDNLPIEKKIVFTILCILLSTHTYCTTVSCWLPSERHVSADGVRKKSLAPRVILYSIDFHMQLTVNNSMGPMAPYGDADLRTLAEVLAWCNGRTKLKLVLTYHQMCSLALTKHNFTENDQGINPQN